MAATLSARVPAGIRVAPATLRDLGATLTDVRLAIAILLTVTTMGAAWIPYTFLAPMIEEKTGGGPEIVGILLVVYGLGAVAGNMLGGFLTDRIGPNRALAVSTLGPIPFMAALTLLPWGPWLGAFLLFGWAGVGWSIAVAQQSRLVMLDPARTQVLLSLQAACIYLGAAIGSSIAGYAKAIGGIPALGIAAVSVALFGVAHLALTIRLSGPRR
jgi:DHA1 family inner membrane transport protein